MNALRRERGHRKGVRRAVVLMPNGLTLGNLLCGVYAIILSFRGDFASAPGFIVLGGIADMLDGRVARATGTGSRFGEELDSLVDAISFGFAPALMVYLGLPNRGNWEWLFIFFFTSCAVMRLARFNVEQAGRKKTHFHGLPSPAAGLTLATYYWFAQTPLYNQAVILFTDSKTLAQFPWHTILLGLMAMLAALMISDVPYPAVPSIGFSNLKQILATIVVAAGIVLLLVRREEFIFPALLAYVLYGVLKWLTIGFLGRSGTPDEIFWEREAELHLTHDERRTLVGRPSDNGDLDEDEDEMAPVSPRLARDATRGARERRPERSGRRERAGREGKAGRESREGREGREGREPREGREAREPREPREPREGRESREGREPRPPREQRPREPRPPREPREPKEPRESKEPREATQPALEPGPFVSISPTVIPTPPAEQTEPTDISDSSELAESGEPQDAAELRAEDITAEPARRRRRRRGGKRGNRPNDGATPPGPPLPESPTGPSE